MFLIVVTNGVHATILCVASEIFHVDITPLATHQSLQLGLIEHGKPGWLDYLAESLEESVGLHRGLYL